MSDSSDLDAMKNWINQLETELNRSKRNLAHSADETQVYKEQLVQFQAQCAELQVKNRHLTRQLDEHTAHPASPAAASQSEVALLRQQLTEKDQVIAALEEKYQALLNSISLLAAKPKDAAETFKAWQSELALRGPPAESDADSSNNPGPTTTFRKQTQHSDNGSKTLVTQGATKTPAERPASQSKSPRPRQEPEPSVEAPTSYSQVVTSRRAEEPRRSRPGQAPVPISHEITARQETLRAEKREEIQKGVGRSQKPNRVGGFQPAQFAERRTDTTVTPAPKQNIASSSDRGQSAPTEFILPKDRPSSSAAPKQNVADSSDRGQSSPAEFILKKDRPPSPAPKQIVATTTIQDRLRQAEINKRKQRESSSVSKQNVAAMTGQGQSSSAESKNLKADLPPLPAPKPNVAASSNRPQPAEFILKEDRPSSSASKQKVAATTVQGQSSPAEFVLKKGLPSSSAPKQNVTFEAVQERLRQAKINLGKQQESSSVSKQNVAATTGQGQSSSAESKNLKADVLPLPTPKPNVTASSNRPQTAEFILPKDRPSSSAPRQNVASEFRLREDPPPSPVPREKAVPVQAPSLKGTQGSVSRELKTPTEPVKYSFDTREAKPSFKAPATYEVPSFLGFDTGSAPQKPNFQVSTPQKPVIMEPTDQQPTKNVMDLSRDPVSWANEMEENDSDEEQRRFGAYGSRRAKAEGHGPNTSRGRGQDRQGRGRGGRGKGPQAPPSHSDPANYLLNQPWRPVREAQPTPPLHPMYQETWRRTDSSDGTRKVTNVIRSETSMRGEGGVALAKEGTEKGVSSPKAGVK